VKGAADLACPRPGVSFNFPTPTKYSELETLACEAMPEEPLAATVFEAGAAFSDLESDFNADASAEATFAEDANFAIETSSDGAPIESFEVTADTENLALEGDSAFATEEANFVDEFAFAATEESNFVEGDFIMADEPVVQQSESTYVSSAVICLLIGVVSLLLA